MLHWWESRELSLHIIIVHSPQRTTSTFPLLLVTPPPPEQPAPSGRQILCGEQGVESCWSLGKYNNYPPVPAVERWTNIIQSRGRAWACCSLSASFVSLFTRPPPQTDESSMFVVISVWTCTRLRNMNGKYLPWFLSYTRLGCYCHSTNNSECLN